MTILETDGMTALCERRGHSRRVSVLLLETAVVGSKVLVFIDSAIRVLDDAEAQQIDNALDGVAAALEGRNFDHLFADLIGREPQLPEALRATPGATVGGGADHDPASASSITSVTGA